MVLSSLEQSSDLKGYRSGGGGGRVGHGVCPCDDI